MSAPASVTPNARRFSIRLPRPLWIGLAALGLIVAAVVLQFGLPICRQQVAIAEIKRLGGQVEIPETAPGWLRRQLGHTRTKLFENATSVYFWRNRMVADSHLSCLDGLPHLSYLSLTATRISDDGIKQLRKLRNLETIQLEETEITDAGLAHLKGMKSLKCLELYGTRVTDAGLVHLKGLTELEELGVEETAVTDAGIADLHRALPGLTISK